MIQAINNILSYLVYVPQPQTKENIIEKVPTFRTVKPTETLEEKTWMKKFHVSSSYSRFDERVQQYNKQRLTSTIF